MGRGESGESRDHGVLRKNIKIYRPKNSEKYKKYPIEILVYTFWHKFR